MHVIANSNLIQEPPFTSHCAHEMNDHRVCHPIALHKISPCTLHEPRSSETQFGIFLCITGIEILHIKMYPITDVKTHRKLIALVLTFMFIRFQVRQTTTSDIVLVSSCARTRSVENKCLCNR